jgi:hypothetical protein
MLRPRHVVVIGSGFGFSVVCLALGLKDNGKGKLDFIDPSYSVLTEGVFKTVGGTAQWSDPEKVRRHFPLHQPSLCRNPIHGRIRKVIFFFWLSQAVSTHHPTNALIYCALPDNPTT